MIWQVFLLGHISQAKCLQQASLVADYFSLSHGGTARDNVNLSPKAADYDAVIKDFGTYGRATVWRAQGGRWVRTGG